MSQRCISPFVYVDQVYAGGRIVEDDDPILQTHREYFAPVNVSSATAATETATAAPGESRSHGKPAKAPPAKATAKDAPPPESKAAQGSDAADPAATSGSSDGDS